MFGIAVTFFKCKIGTLAQQSVKKHRSDIYPRKKSPLFIKSKSII